MPPRRVKKEPTTIIVDYPTPGESVRSAGSVAPKQEPSTEINLVSEEETDLPLSPQRLSFKSQATEDEGYASRAANTQSNTTSKSYALV